MPRSFDFPPSSISLNDRHFPPSRFPPSSSIVSSRLIFECDKDDRERLALIEILSSCFVQLTCLDLSWACDKETYKGISVWKIEVVYHVPQDLLQIRG